MSQSVTVCYSLRQRGPVADWLLPMYRAMRDLYEPHSLVCNFFENGELNPKRKDRCAVRRTLKRALW